MNSPQNIVINTSAVKLTVNDDTDRVIEFDPANICFIENLYTLISEFEKKEKELRAREVALNRDKSVDKHGIPNNIIKKAKLARETCDYMRKKIDLLFGEGTSKAAFGNSYNLDVFPQFFDGITPFIEKAREKKIGKYVNLSGERASEGEVME